MIATIFTSGYTFSTMPSRRDILGGLGSVGALVMTGCLDVGGSSFTPGSSGSTNWPTPRHDARNTAYAPDAVVPRDSVTERWAVDAGYDVRTPTVADGTVFAPSSEGLIAIASESGDRLWQFVPPEREWTSPAAVLDGVAYVTTVGGRLYAVDVARGEQRWSLPDATTIEGGPHLLTGPTVDEPLVVVANDDGILRGLEPETGDERWRTEVFGTVRTVAYDVPRLYLGTVGGAVYAYSYAAGSGDEPSERWRRKVGSSVESIVPMDNGLVVSTFAGPLRNLRRGAHAGTTDWTASDADTGSLPVAAGSRVLSASRRTLSSIRTYDQHVHWRVDGEFADTGPVAAGDTVFVPGDGAVHAYSFSGGTGIAGARVGAKRWSHEIESTVVQGLAVGDGALIVATEAPEGGGPTVHCLETA